MAIKLKNWISVFIFLSSGCFFNQQVKAQSSMKVAGNHAPPFRIIRGPKFSGIYFDIIKELGERIGVEIEFVNQPFKRALRSMDNGSVDIMIGPNRTAEREVYMAYLDAPLAKVNKAFYVRPDASVITKYEDLQDKQIAIQRGSIYFPRFDRDNSIKKVAVNKYEQGVKMLLIKRVDVLIIPELEGDYLLQQLGIKLKKSPFVVEGKSSYITISKKSSALALSRKIETALKQMNADGSIQKILNRYSLQAKSVTPRNEGTAVVNCCLLPL